MIQAMVKLYYQLTAHIPRPLPKDLDQYRKMQEIFLKYYDLEDKLEIWAVVANQVQAGPPHRLWKDYASIVNSAKKLGIQKIVQEEKERVYRLLEAKLKTKLEEVVNELPTDLPTGTPNSDASMQVVS